MEIHNSVQIFKSNLIRIRKERGLTQKALAEKMGINQRLVAYYEGKATNIPLSKVQDFADALDVSVVTLLDPRKRGSEIEELDIRTVRKLKQIEKLPRRAQEALWHTINTTIEMNAIKKQRKDKPDK